MIAVVKTWWKWFLVGLILLSQSGSPDGPLKSETQLRISSLKKAITTLKPRLEPKKLQRYANAIYKAAHRYQIDPNLLVAIAQQESSFRNLQKEGRAGEYGICQIQKIWLKNPMFKKEFGVRNIASLKDPAQNFLFAAWLLSSLKDKYQFRKTRLPWWTYYNAYSYRPRSRYYRRIHRKLVRIEKSLARQLATVRFPSKPPTKLNASSSHSS